MGLGNLRSVHKALLKVGADVCIARRPEEMADAQAVVLPGVGAFDDCIHALQQEGAPGGCAQFHSVGPTLSGYLRRVTRPCLKRARNSTVAPLVGHLSGQGRALRRGAGLKIPQIGWNQLEIVKPVFRSSAASAAAATSISRHSFFPQPADACIVATRTGESFASSVWRHNVFATQFHPRKREGRLAIAQELRRTSPALGMAVAV